MAEKGYPFTNNATGDGTSGGYTAAEWRKIHRYLFGDGVALEGNQLAVTGAASPLAVNTGHAVVDGLFYDNTASVNLTVSTPVVNTTGGHVILRASYAAQTVRLIAVRNTDGVAAIPSLTQTSETTYEIRLASFTITTGGVITLTDARTFLHYNIRLDRNAVDGGTATRIPFNDANGRLTDASSLTYSTTGPQFREQGTAPGLWFDETDGAVKGGFIGLDNGIWKFQRHATNFGAFESTLFQMDIVNGQITISPAAANPPFILSANAQGQRVAGLVAEPVGTLGLRRQGGNASNWGTVGTTDYTPATTDGARVQAGAVTATHSAAPTATVALTFPVAFSATPIVVASHGNTTQNLTINVGTPTASGFQIQLKTVDGSSISASSPVYWYAIGPQ